jgi:hypothetical protein
MKSKTTAASTAREVVGIDPIRASGHIEGEVALRIGRSRHPRRAAQPVGEIQGRVADSGLFPVDPASAEDVSGPGVAVYECAGAAQLGEQGGRIDDEATERLGQVEVRGPLEKRRQFASRNVPQSLFSEHRGSCERVVQPSKIGQGEISRRGIFDCSKQKPTIARVDERRSLKREIELAEHERLSRRAICWADLQDETVSLQDPGRPLPAEIDR